jgi:hypothetical protein
MKTELKQIAKWRAHEIHYNHNESIIGCMINNQLIASASSIGDLRLWNIKGELLARFNDRVSLQKYPSDKIYDLFS